MKIGIHCVVFLFILFAGVRANHNDTVYATTTRHELHLKDALEIAVRQNPHLTAEKEKLRIGEASLKQAKRFFQQNPELSIDADYRKRKFASPSGDSGTDFELRLLQEIEISGQRTHRVMAAEKYLQAAQWRLAETERQLRLNVSLLFYELQTVQEKIKIQSQRLILHETLLEAGQKRFKEEDISILEIDTLRFDRDQVQYDLLTLEAQKLSFEKSLRVFLGMGEGPEVVASGTLSENFQQVRGIPQTLDVLKDCALQHRPDLKVEETMREGDDAALQLETSKKMPNMAFGPLFKSDNEDTVIGASLVIPLPFFNRNLDAVTKARIHLDVRQIALETKKREIQQEVAAAYRVLQLANSQFNRFGEGYLENLRKRSTFPQKAYGAGEIGIFEFSMAQGRLTEAQMRYFDILLELIKAKANLVSQIGQCEIHRK